MTSVRTPIDTEINAVISSLETRLICKTWDGKLAWKRYGALIEGNFVHWLLSAHLRCHGLPTKEILLANLHDEVVDDHPGLLRTLLHRNDLLPSQSDQVHVSALLFRIRALCASGNPGTLLTFLVILESFSCYFLPAMANRAGLSTRSPYIVAHLEADQDHATQLQFVLKRAYDDGHVSTQAIDAGIELANAFFDVLFD